VVNRAVEKGKAAENDVVKWLRSAGVPSVVRNGHQTARAGRVGDRGDISMPGVVIQVKDWTGPRGSTRRPLSDLQVAQFLEAAQRQATTARAAVGLLVEKRRGQPDAGGWWCWLPCRTAIALLGARHDLRDPALPTYPIRLRLADITPALAAFARLCASTAEED
jgi:hypothetical protein